MRELETLESLLLQFKSLILSLDKNTVPSSMFFRFGRILGQFDILKEKLNETKTPS